MVYRLPSHLSRRCLDPLGITDIDEPLVWAVIEGAIQTYRSGGLAVKSIDALAELLDTLTYSIHGKSTNNAQFLTRTLKEEFGTTETLSILDQVLDLALHLPSSFNSHSFHHISAENPRLTLTGLQARVLIAHQFLGTLTPSPGNTWGCNLSQWYSEPQALPHAIRGYILTALHYLNGPEPPPVSYELVVNTSCGTSLVEYGWAKCSANVFDHLIIEPISPRTVQFPHKQLRTQLVAANKEPGFGSSCTQEELITAACPALLPLGAILFAPPIPDDGVLVVKGATSISSWEGQGRDARLTEILPSPTSQLLLLMDALEFDVQQCDNEIPDLIPGNLLRELTKAYTGFQAVHDHGQEEIAAPLWGAGAFNGDPVIKALILAMAAAKAGIRVYLSVDVDRAYASPSGEKQKLHYLLCALKQKFSAFSVGELWSRLKAPEALHHLLEQ